MIFNMIGSGGGLLTKSTLIISIDSGSTVIAYSDSSYTTRISTAEERDRGEYWFTGLDNGDYYIEATLNNITSRLQYSILEYGVYRINMYYRSIPVFTYTYGTYEIVQDNDTVINDPTTYQGNWKIRFLTSGTLKFTTLYGAENGIDIFLVGGGGNGSGGYNDGTAYRKPGGGGGGGYTVTYRHYSPLIGRDIPIVIGGATGSSSFESIFALGGRSGSNSNGGRGGSGGGAGPAGTGAGANGGSNGANGSNNTSATGGAGQGTITREFGETNGKLYAGGGGGGAYSSATAGTGGAGGGGNGSNNRAVGKNGETNTGGGGGGAGGGSGGAALASESVGGSGIVIIRNTR